MTKHNPRIRLAAGLSAALVATSWMYPMLAEAATPAPVVDSGTGGENGRIIGRVTGGGLAGTINARSFRWGATLAVSATGGAAGKPTFGDLTFGKLIDVNSPGLMNSVASGVHFPTLTLEVFTPGTTTVLVKYDLSDVLIVGVTTGDRGRPNGSGQPMEEVSVSYSKILTTVGIVSICYDIVRAARC